MLTDSEVRLQCLSGNSVKCKLWRGTGGRETLGKGGKWDNFLRWWEAEEKGKNYSTLHNILQSKNCKEVGARVGTRIKGYGKWEV